MWPRDDGTPAAPSRFLDSVSKDVCAWNVEGMPAFWGEFPEEIGECVDNEPLGEPIGPRSAASAGRTGRRSAPGTLSGRVGGDGFLWRMGDAASGGGSKGAS